jgi:hypothetical protein
MFRRFAFRLAVPWAGDGRTMGLRGEQDQFTADKRDERLHDFIPESVEAELDAKAAASTPRAQVVEHGRGILRGFEAKSGAAALYPSVSRLLKLYKADAALSQRALNFLLHPAPPPVPDLVAAFPENLKHLIDAVDQKGSSVHDPTATPAPASAPSSSTAAAAAATEAEDVTYLCKCLAAMALANGKIGDVSNAVRCCDVAAQYAVEGPRKAGLRAMQAGLLVQQKKFAEALASARAAIAAHSGSAQGYMHGATALRMLGKADEAVALLEQGLTALPGHAAITAQIAQLKAAASKRS